MSRDHPVRPLSTEVARKIAAGEVIERPGAIIREFMDNAIDAGSSSVCVEITGGGIDCIRVIDDGSGMTKEDLTACARPHATSKIADETDLLKLSTLGFRGEALSSIAAVCRLSIISGNWKLRASITEDHIIEPVSPVAGTIVQSEGLFENFPARRRFLKRPASEGAVCRSVFIEKTLPRPDIAFRFVTDGIPVLDLEAGVTLTQRFLQAAGIRENESLFYELSGSSGNNAPDWGFRLVLGEPGVSRTNRKDIFIFVNGRRITEFALQQAIEYGGQGYFPNGTYPVAALFVTMNPALVDFNIHPAKKEVRFQDISALHHAVSTSVRTFLHQYTVKTMIEGTSESENSQQQFKVRKNDPELYATASSPAAEPVPAVPPETIPDQTPDLRTRWYSGTGTPEHRYEITHTAPDTTVIINDTAPAAAPEKTAHFIGSALGTFLIAEKNDTLYIIDKHAAHERILYNKIMAGQGKRQQLLIPYIIETESDADDAYLAQIQDKLDDAGFTIKNSGNGRWEITALPERWQGSETETYHALLDRRIEPDEVISEIAATTACKAAVKDGYVLDDETASLLADAALCLPDPHCPHGRPVYTTITKNELFLRVKRT
jgi:DNA mismatch repair protein MutL